MNCEDYKCPYNSNGICLTVCGDCPYRVKNKEREVTNDRSSEV